MQNVKDRALVRMLNCLDRKQRKGFTTYLECSLFNTNPSLNVLYECLEKRALNRKVKFLSHEQLLEGSGISIRLVDKLCSQLLTLLNRFVVVWAEQKEDRPRFAATFLAWKGLGLEPELLEREYRKMKRKLDKLPPSEFDAVHALQLEHVHAQYLASQHRKKHQDIYSPLLENLESFYQTHWFKYQCAQVSASGIFAKQKSAQLADKSQFLATTDLLPPVGQAYAKALQTITEAHPSLFQIREFSEFLSRVADQISRIDRIDLYGYLLNACISQLPTGKPGFDLEVSNTYDVMLEQELLPIETYFRGAHFKNIVAIKVRIGEIEQAETFINAYQNRLSPDEKPLLLPYSFGLLHFFSNDFKKAIVIFKRIIEDNPEDLFWGFEARNMLWKSYFEAYDLLTMEEHQEMLQLYHSFRIFVARNKKLAPRRKKAYQNFIRVFNRLIRARDKALWGSNAAQRKELEEIQAMAVEADHLIHRKWILEALEGQLSSLKA